MPSELVDLTVTSPPYDNLRTYKGFSFNFESIANELYRITKPGGVVVWVVGDATIQGSESGTSFKQALYFKDIGFNIHDTMIYRKLNAMPNPNSRRYRQAFEFMFVLSKGLPKTFNPIQVEIRRKDIGKQRKVDGSLENYSKQYTTNKYRKIDNIFEYGVGGQKTDHPAIFPEQLAHDHIITWSNESEIVFDPMCGSGTTLKMAKQLGRNFLGFDISNEYVEITKQRIV